MRPPSGAGVKTAAVTRPSDVGSDQPNIVRGDMPLPDPRDFHTPQSTYTRQDLLKSGEGGYFGPGNAQLPAPPMLMMDRITEISMDGGEFGKGHIIDELDITPRGQFPCRN